MTDQAKIKEDVLDIMDVDETNEQIKAFVAQSTCDQDDSEHSTLRSQSGTEEMTSISLQCPVKGNAPLQQPIPPNPPRHPTAQAKVT